MPSEDYIRNCISSKDMDDDWSFEDAVDAELIEEKNPPDAGVDLREKKNWWKIGDQGKTGSCVGWAVGDAVLRYHFVQEKILKTTQLVSVRYLWIAAKEFDESVKRPTTFIERAGTNIKTALRIAQKYGVIPDSILQFKTNQFFEGKFQRFYHIASQLRINGFYNLGSGTDTNSLNHWRQWLHQHGPIATRLNLDSTWIEALDDDTGKLEHYKQDTAEKGGGHAVAIVGYTPDGGFIIRNSWGTTWGDGGYGYASESYTRDALTEAYGVILRRKLEDF